MLKCHGTCTECVFTADEPQACKNSQHTYIFLVKHCLHVHNLKHSQQCETLNIHLTDFTHNLYQCKLQTVTFKGSIYIQGANLAQSV